MFAIGETFTNQDALRMALGIALIVFAFLGVILVVEIVRNWKNLK